MSTTVSYKGQTLTTVSNDTKTLLTEGKYLEDDLTLVDVSGGGSTLITKSISANGTYNASSDSADGYSQVNVAVPNTYTNADEGKVVSDGALVAQTSKNINSNGTHSTVTNNQVVVAVPNSYSASDEGKVVSNGALVAQTSDTVTTNDTYDTTLINSLTVNVSGGGCTESVWMDAQEPTDTKMHIWIDITDGIHKVNIKLAGITVNVNWGDGNTDTSVSSEKSHTYASDGVYEIVVDWNGTVAIPDDNSVPIVFFPDNLDITRRLIRRVYIPNTVSDIGKNRFIRCNALEKCTFKNQGSLGNNAFDGCYTLRDINIGEGVTTIGTGCFQYAYSAYNVIIPSTCTQISNNAFNGCKARSFHIKAETPPTLSNVNAFNLIDSSAKIYVPRSENQTILNTYKTTTNWSNFASRMQEEST